MSKWAQKIHSEGEKRYIVPKFGENENKKTEIEHVSERNNSSCEQTGEGVGGKPQKYNECKI